jgi:hypothetical protein
VATTLSNDGSICRDLNSFGHIFYDTNTLSFFAPHDGDATELSDDPVRVYHPVLFKREYKRKMERLKQSPRERPGFKGFADA